MKKTAFILAFLGFVFLNTIQAKNDNLFEKHHKKVFAIVNNNATFRAGQGSGTQLDSMISTNSKGKDKEVYSYNSNGQISTIIYFYLDNGIWVNSGKTQYTYDANNNLSEYLEQDWDETNSIWANRYKVIITYNAAGKVSLETSYVLNNSVWSYNSKESYLYDSNNQLLSDTTYTYSSNSWTYLRKENYTYDSNANLITKIKYQWDETNLAWTTSSKYEFSYTNSLLNSTTAYLWSNNSWTNLDKESYSYDTNANLTEYISQSWTGTAWGLRYKSRYTYKAAYLLSNLNVPDDYKTLYIKSSDLRLSYNNMLTKKADSTETSTNVWAQSNEDLYYYNNQSNAVFNATASNIKVTIENGTAIISGLTQGEYLAVYNLQGVTIYSQKAASEMVSVNLPGHGVYVVKVGNESVKVVY
jgi:hypothetical protein